MLLLPDMEDALENELENIQNGGTNISAIFPDALTFLYRNIDAGIFF